MPPALEALVTTGAACRILKVNAAVPVPPAFVAEIVALCRPTVVGVPLMTPLAASKLKPAGAALSPKLVGLFVAVIW